MLELLRKLAHRRYLFSGGKSRQHRAGWAREGVSLALGEIVAKRETLMHKLGINLT